MTRTTITTAAVALAAALAAPVAAQANSLHDHHAAKGPAPKVIVTGPKKPLTLQKAKEAQERSARTGKFPPAPRLASNRGLRKADTQEISTRIRRNVAATEIPVVQTEPTTARPQAVRLPGHVRREAHVARELGQLHVLQRARGHLPPAQDL